MILSVLELELYLHEIDSQIGVYNDHFHCLLADGCRLLLEVATYQEKLSRLYHRRDKALVSATIVLYLSLSYSPLLQPSLTALSYSSLLQSSLTALSSILPFLLTFVPFILHPPLFPFISFHLLFLLPILVSLDYLISITWSAMVNLPLVESFSAATRGHYIISIHNAGHWPVLPILHTSVSVVGNRWCLAIGLTSSRRGTSSIRCHP